MDTVSCKHDPSLRPFPAPSLLPGDWGQAWNHGLVLSVTSPGWLQEPTRSHLIRTNQTSIIQDIPKDLGALCQELQSETKQ